MQKINIQVNHQDERGVIIDLIENANINAITFISLKKGAIRANHYHKKTNQWNYVIKGEIKLITQIGNDSKNEIILKKGDIALTIPMEKHALVALKDSEMLAFTEGPRGGKEYESDTYRLEKPLV